MSVHVPLRGVVQLRLSEAAECVLKTCVGCAGDGQTTSGWQRTEGTGLKALAGRGLLLAAPQMCAAGRQRSAAHTRPALGVPALCRTPPGSRRGPRPPALRGPALHHRLRDGAAALLLAWGTLGCSRHQSLGEPPKSPGSPLGHGPCPERHRAAPGRPRGAAPGRGRRRRPDDVPGSGPARLGTARLALGRDPSVPVARGPVGPCAASGPVRIAAAGGVPLAGCGALR